MARPRGKNREEAFKKFLESDGKITTKELAAEAGVTEGRIREWRSKDRWNDKLEEYKRKRRKPGGQPGNKNAQGHGAPEGNTNAEKSGAFKAVRLDKLPEDERKRIVHLLEQDDRARLAAELLLLYAKEAQLEKLLEEFPESELELMWNDQKIVTEQSDKEPTTVTVQSSAFSRRLTIEREITKVHGKIIKMLDSMRNYELEQEKLKLENKKLSLLKQKIAGSYEIDPDTGEIIVDE